MTQDRFLKLLDNPDLLATISYEELKTLALSYPYANNLRYLLAIKSSQDQHPDFQRNLAVAAAYSLDRSCLLSLIMPKQKQAQPAPVVLDEQVLELKPIATVQRELESRSPVRRTAEDTAPQKEKQAAEVQADGNKTETNAKMPHTNLTQTAARKEAEAPEKIYPERDMPSFSVWISRFNPPDLSIPAVASEPETVPVKVTGEIPEAQPHDELTPQMLAEKSVTESKSILSETLARLYADQGYREKAIDMYERLGLAFPDKSAYFAAEIEKLKK